jgi:hypothetical protein
MTRASARSSYMSLLLRICCDITHMHRIYIDPMKRKSGKMKHLRSALTLEVRPHTQLPATIRTVT